MNLKVKHLQINNATSEFNLEGCSVHCYNSRPGWVEGDEALLPQVSPPCLLLLPHQPGEPQVEPSLVLAPAPVAPGLTRILLLGWFPLSLSLAAPPALEPRTTTGNLSPSHSNTEIDIIIQSVIFHTFKIFTNLAKY